MVRGAMQSSSREIVSSRTRLRVLIILLALGAAELVLSAAQAKAPINLDVLARDGYGLVRISRPQPNTLLVRGNINGRDASLVLDTGWAADGISLDSSYAMFLNLPTQALKGRGMSASGARMDFKGGMAASVVLGNVQLRGVPLLVGTIGALKNEQIRRSVGASGFVGAGFLHTNSAIIDLQNLCLYLRPPGKGRRVQLRPALKAAGLSEVPFTRAGRNNLVVDVEINGVRAKMFLDTGAYLTGMDKRFAAQAKITGYGGLGGIDAAGVISQKQLTRVGSFKIGGVPVNVRDLTLTQYGFYSMTGGKVVGLLGMDVLGQNWGIIDFGQQKLYIASAK
jgi:predicted aspartyl protease